MMTIEDKHMRNTIDMAREAGFMRTVHGGAEVSRASMDCLKAFEALVRADAIADEREACAKVCDDWPNGRDDVYSIGVAIRARSKA
jgi:hypothetical protein